MVSWGTMIDKSTGPRGIIHGVRLTEAERDALLRLAAELGCLRPGGDPSISRLLVEIVGGSIRVKRSRPARAESQAERIRAAILASPDAQNRDIAAMLGLEGHKGLVNVASERRRMRLRDEAKGKQ